MKNALKHRERSISDTEIISDAHVNVNEAWYTDLDEDALLWLGICYIANVHCFLLSDSKC